MLPILQNMPMHRRTALTLLLGATGLLIAPQGWAQQALTIPRWRPPLGKTIAWRLQFELHRKRTGFPIWRESGYELVQRMTVLAETPDGYSVAWELVPPVGRDRDTETFRFAMEAYGVKQIVIGTDAAGLPLRLFGAETMRKRLEDLIAAGQPSDPDSQSLLKSMLTAADRDPLFEANAFARASFLIGRIQRAQDWPVRVGETIRTRQSDYMLDAPLSGEADMRLEKIDVAARMAHLAWTWNIPLDNFPQWAKDLASSEIAKGEQMSRALPGPDREEATSALSRYSGVAEISLEDGSLIRAQERRELRISTETTILTLRISRD